MSDRKAFYVRIQDESTPNAGAMATSIQVIIPDGLNKWEAKEYALGRIVNELARYALDEALSGWYPS